MPRRPLEPRVASAFGPVPNPFRGAPLWLQPLLLAALAAAIVLLHLAVLPARVIPSTAAAVLVARRRAELALAGITLLAAVALAAVLV